jgi:hypothetical protein
MLIPNHREIIMVVQYLGPQTVLPFASIVAAVIGAILLFGRYIVGLIRRTVRKLFASRTTDETDSAKIDETSNS